MRWDIWKLLDQWYFSLRQLQGSLSAITSVKSNISTQNPGLLFMTNVSLCLQWTEGRKKLSWLNWENRTLKCPESTLHDEHLTAVDWILCTEGRNSVSRVLLLKTYYFWQKHVISNSPLAQWSQREYKKKGVDAVLAQLTLTDPREMQVHFFRASVILLFCRGMFAL